MRLTLRLGALSLWWERAWPALWPVTATAGVFLVVSLFDGWRSAPAWLHLALLVAFAAAFALALAQAVRAMAWPRHREVQRRTEIKSGLAHRPLATLDDRLAGEGSDAATAALWALHRERMARAAREVRVGWPRAGLGRRDPRALRTALGLVLAIALVGAGGEGPELVARAFAPDFSNLGTPPGTLEAWIAPPAYTGLPPLTLDAAETVVGVPQASEIVALVHGGPGVPLLRLDAVESAFDSSSPRDHHLSQALTRGGRLEIVQGGETLGAWTLEVTPDRAPDIGFAEEPSETARAAFKVSFEARDDYGLQAAKMVVRRAGSDDTLELGLPLGGPRPEAASETAYYDLTPHPWAGLAVTIVLAATDELGQEGLSEALEIVLPERVFHNPVARAIVEQRRTLVEDPGARETVSDALALLSRLGPEFGDDIVVFLGLQSATKRLRYDRGAGAVDSVIELLWQTALRAEDGGLTTAEAELRRAQQALRDALDRGADDAEIDALVDSLQAALDRFLQALAERAETLAQEGVPLEALDSDAMTITADDLRSVLDRIRELGQGGARDRAQELLSQLQDILENLRPGGQRFALGEDGAELEEALESLAELMRGQRELLDRTFRSAQDGEAAPAEADAMAAEQEALRRALGDLMSQLGGMGRPIPDALGDAELAMRAARDALGRGRPGEAVGPEGEALEGLREGSGAVIADLIEEFGGQSFVGRQEWLRQFADPFGRARSTEDGDGADGDVAIPEKGELQKARAIIEELYRRAGQRRRSQAERDYINRLLRRF